ncbi:unnamed protein product, partial [Linum tenue]
RTSWTDANPGRRFYGCSKFGTNRACNYFRWYDPALDEHMRCIVQNFHRRIIELERRQPRGAYKISFKMASILTVVVLVVVFILLGK